MKSSLIWGIISLIILSTATVRLSEDVNSPQYKTLIFFTLLFILYYLSLAIGLIKIDSLKISGLISLSILIIIGAIYILSDYDFTYFMYPVIIIALLIYLASGILLIIALKETLENIIPNTKFKTYKKQILLSIFICIAIIIPLQKISFMRNSTVAIAIFSVFLFIMYIFSENKIDYKANILIMTLCFIISVLIININLEKATFIQKKSYKILSLVLLAISWGWSSNRILKSFFKKQRDSTSYFVFLAFAFAALGFYQILIIERGLNTAWEDIIEYRNILLLFGIFIGWSLAFRSKKANLGYN